MKNNIIYNKDCLGKNGLKQLPENSVDFLLTDPPYGTNDKYGKVIRRGQEDVKFDIDYDKKTNLAFIEYLPKIMKDDRWGVIFIDRKEVTTFWYELEQNGLKPRNTFYWVKSNKAPTPRNNFKSSIETAIVFTKGRTNKHWFGGGNQDNYLIAPFVTGHENTNVPAQKPIKLFKHLMELFTEKGDIVLDPFIGSGTTAEIAKTIGRKYIGFEINSEYYEIAEDRILKIQETLI